MRRATFLVTALLAVGAVAGCGDDDKNRGGGGSEGYPAAVEENFMSECKRTSGGKTAACQCAFDKIEQTITYAEFKDEEARLADGKAPSKAFTNAIEQCS